MSYVTDYAPAEAFTNAAEACQAVWAELAQEVALVLERSPLNPGDPKKIRGASQKIVPATRNAVEVLEGALTALGAVLVAAQCEGK